MRIFLYEYTCAEMTDPGMASLRAEGKAMLDAIAEDYRRIPGISVVTLAQGGEAAFRAQVRAADFTLVIAPEFDALLETRARWVLEEGGHLLGSTPQGIRATADKLTLGREWELAGVPTPPCRLLTPDGDVPDNWFPVVCKLRDGAGSQAMFRAADRTALQCEVQPLPVEGWHGERIVQPFITGQPASVAFIVGANNSVPLLPATQQLSRDGRFAYEGGTLPLPIDLGERAVRLAQLAIAGIPGLRGYVGVDVVLGEDAGDDRAIEINPRLTTSYVGLRALCEDNLATLMLQAARGGKVDIPTWRSGRIYFDPHGQLRHVEKMTWTGLFRQR